MIVLLEILERYRARLTSFLVLDPLFYRYKWDYTGINEILPVEIIYTATKGLYRYKFHDTGTKRLGLV
jgi:hypothetical protein